MVDPPANFSRANDRSLAFHQRPMPIQRDSLQPFVLALLVWEDGDAQLVRIELGFDLVHKRQL